MTKNTGKYTVITGASSGIGYEAAKAFAERGSNLIIAARRKDRLEKLKQEILNLHPERDIIIKITDLSEPDNVLNFYKSIKDYPLITWINNAGIGNYGSVEEQNLHKIRRMLHLNVEAVAVLSSLFVRDFKDTEAAQLINISSSGGYTIVPNAVTYCAAKFFVAAFTEGLAQELKESGAKMKAKVFAPAATKTEFGKTANNVDEYDYDRHFDNYHTSVQAAEFLLRLYDSDEVVGIVDREDFKFRLCSTKFEYAGNSQNNQKK